MTKFRFARSALGLAVSASLLVASSVFAAPIAGRSKLLLFVQPNATAPAQISSGFDAQVIETYEGGTVLSVAQTQVQIVAARAAAAGVSAVVRDNFDLIYLPHGKIDSRFGTAASNPGKLLRGPYSSGETGLFLLQFHAPIKASWVDELTALGIQAVQYVPFNTLIVAATPEQMVVAATRPFVQFTDLYHPSLKADFVDVPPGSRGLIVIEVPRTTGTAVVDRIRQLAVDAPKVEVIGDETRITATFDGSAVPTIRDMPLVIGLTSVPTLLPSDERVAIGISSNITATGIPINHSRYTQWLKSLCGYCDTLAADGFNVGIAEYLGLDAPIPMLCPAPQLR
ncbi:MAG TPA: hypothetical protein VER58_03080 [Thermoanaerobaculia bacterium]|nr:hypothetical protein [Thermoanaerobaculia bacterium]